MKYMQGGVHSSCGVCGTVKVFHWKNDRPTNSESQLILVRWLDKRETGMAATAPDLGKVVDRRTGRGWRKEARAFGFRYSDKAFVFSYHNCRLLSSGRQSQKYSHPPVFAHSWFHVNCIAVIWAETACLLFWFLNIKNFASVVLKHSFP